VGKTIEIHYPNNFRLKDTKTLAQHILDHSSVVLVGMKRVGISNFLRFFLNNTAVSEQYFRNSNLLFFTVDAHDLIECAIGPFWTLLLKRMTDTIEESNFSEVLKKQSREYFLESIQLKDTFYTYDCVQKLFSQISGEGFYPVLVLTRFDRLLPAFTPEFFANLQGLKDAAGKLSYIFTSYRPLEQLKPDVFTPSSMSVFAHTQYLKPAESSDAEVVLETLLNRYAVHMSDEHKQILLHSAAGHVQYLHLEVIGYKDSLVKENSSFSLEQLEQNESIDLQSEELFEELIEKEKQLCIKICQKEELSDLDLKNADYLFNTGLVTKNHEIFSKLLYTYIEKTASNHTTKPREFSRQEQTLFNLFEQNINRLVERNDIVETVWPDQAEDGVSDWAIDRLVARLRQKIKARSEPFKIVTVVTRGYRLEKV